MAEKKFHKLAQDIKPIVEGYGACFATDRILVDGCKVRFFYREAPDNDVDSGWRFMAGDESDEYMSTASNHGIYDVNTIANYDSDVVPFLESPVGSAFERRSVDQPFEEVSDFFPAE